MIFGKTKGTRTDRDGEREERKEGRKEERKKEGRNANWNLVRY
jgi:hypothetical protein